MKEEIGKARQDNHLHLERQALQKEKGEIQEEKGRLQRKNHVTIAVGE
jgi:uncharacterized protein YjbJ (UPF0337 family)